MACHVRVELLKLKLKLRHAAAANDFRLVYQPIVDARQNTIAGFEALMRWTDQTGKDLPPSIFVPLAEEIGLMERLGSWVLREACIEAAGWPSDQVIAVNVSAAQVNDPGFTDIVRDALTTSGLPAERLEIELTETAALSDKSEAARILSGVRDLGVGIALDDFGTCYSSLSMVQRLPLTRLKIDRSFVQTIDGSRKTIGIARAVMEIARCFDLAVTAEGVETRDQMRALLAIGCRDMQGYLFGKPRPIEAWREAAGHSGTGDDHMSHRARAFGQCGVLPAGGGAVDASIAWELT